MVIFARTGAAIELVNNGDIELLVSDNEDGFSNGNEDGKLGNDKDDDDELFENTGTDEDDDDTTINSCFNVNEFVQTMCRSGTSSKFSENFERGPL